MDPEKPSQQIILNRTRNNSIEFGTQQLELVLPRGRDYKFPIAVVNYGTPTRVYLAPSHEIETAVRFSENDFVAVGKTVIDAIAHIDAMRHGTISVTIGYGANTGSFDLNLAAEAYQNIEVDPGLGVPGTLSRHHVTLRVRMPAAVKAFGTLMTVLVILSLLTDAIPASVGAISATLLLAILIMYFLAPYS